MTDSGRRAAIAGAAATQTSLGLSGAHDALSSTERRIRAVLVANVERSARDLAAAIERGERPEEIEHSYRYGHQLDREELRLFDRFQGSWRELFGLPVVYV